MSFVRETDSHWHAAGVLLAILIGLAFFQAPKPVAIAVEGGHYRFEPASIRLRVTVERDARNRGLLVGLHSAGFATSSYEALAGEAASRTRWRTYADVPAGLYQAYAVIERVDGTRAEDIAAFTVYERGF